MFTFDQPLSCKDAAIRGGLAVVLGGVLMAWPGITIGTVVALFAIYLFADAAVSAVRLFDRGRDAGDRVLLGLRAVIEVAAAITAIAYPGITASVMTVVVGIYAIVAGGVELAAAGRLSKLGLSGTGWLIVSGLLALVTGIALVVWPSIGAVTLALVFGAYLAISGVMLLISAAMTPRGEAVPA
jgi:uncharacterized membrane protein HdeD (DUF308 family)